MLEAMANSKPFRFLNPGLQIALEITARMRAMPPQFLRRKAKERADLRELRGSVAIILIIRWTLVGELFPISIADARRSSSSDHFIAGYPCDRC